MHKISKSVTIMKVKVVCLSLPIDQINQIPDASSADVYSVFIVYS